MSIFKFDSSIRGGFTEVAGIIGDTGLLGAAVTIGAIGAIGDGFGTKGVEVGFAPTTRGFAGIIDGGGGAAVGMVGLGSGKSGIYHSIIA